MGFYEVKAEEMVFNPFTKIGKDWMLITAGSQDKFNTMTASWGGFGVFWGKNTATIYVRPQRYTKEFIDSNDCFTLSFFDNQYRQALSLCGTVSGRDRNKVEEAKLTPYFVDGTTAFSEASMILVCKKLYHDSMDETHMDAPEHDSKWYPEKDYHTFYIAEVQKILVSDSGK